MIWYMIQSTRPCTRKPDSPVKYQTPDNPIYINIQYEQQINDDNDSIQRIVTATAYIISQSSHNYVLTSWARFREGLGWKPCIYTAYEVTKAHIYTYHLIINTINLRQCTTSQIYNQRDLVPEIQTVQSNFGLLATLPISRYDWSQPHINTSSLNFHRPDALTGAQQTV